MRRHDKTTRTTRTRSFFFCNKTVSNSGEVNIWIPTQEQRAFLSDLEGISPSQSTARKLIFYGVEIEFLCVLYWQIRMSWAFLEAIVIGVLSSSFKESPCIAVSLGKRCPRATKPSRRGLKRRKKRITIKGYVKYKGITLHAVKYRISRDSKLAYLPYNISRFWIFLCDKIFSSNIDI